MSINRVAPTQAAIATRLPDEAVDTAMSVSGSTISKIIEFGCRLFGDNLFAGIDQRLTSRSPRSTRKCTRISERLSTSACFAAADQGRHCAN